MTPASLSVTTELFPSLITEDGQVYRDQGIVGKGMSAYVHAVLTPKNGTLRAMKLTRPENYSKESALREVGILKDAQKISHVVKFNACVDFPKNQVGIVMQLLRQDCFEALESSGFTSEEIQSIARQLLEMLRDFHSREMIYGDLKSENMSYDRSSGELTVFDLGHTRHKSLANPLNPGGTYKYRSPECTLFTPFDMRSDIWSLGATLFELYTGEHLVPTVPGDAQLTDKLHLLELNFGKPIPQELIESAPEAIKNLFYKDSDGAYTILEDLSDDGEETAAVLRQKGANVYAVELWQARIYNAAESRGDNSAVANKMIDLIAPMLEFCPKKRITAAGALHDFFS